MSVTSTALTVAGTAAGTVAVFVGGLLADAWRTRLGIRAAKDERDDVRQAQRRDRRDAFELDTLLELQEVLPRMARAAHLGYQHDKAHFLATGHWARGGDPLPDDVGGEGQMEMLRTFSRLRSRIFDEDLRDSLSAWNTELARLALGRDYPGQSDAEAQQWAEQLQFGALTVQLDELSQRIGSRIRQLHEE